MNEKIEALFQALWEAQDEAYDLMAEYDAIPHSYGDYILYHAEGQVVDLIAAHPGITCTDIANLTKKTTSACSQIVRKLKDRDLIRQIRNEKNNRKYNLELTDNGRTLYEERQRFTKECQQIMLKMMGDFTEEELFHHIQVQKKINEAYKGDIERSRTLFQNKTES